MLRDSFVKVGEPKNNAKHILCVEDNADIGELIQLVLNNSRCCVHWVADARQARAFLNHTRPDLVLLDLMLPETSGLDFLEELRADARYCELPVVVVTVCTSAKKRERAHSLCVQHYIMKPFSLVEIRRLVIELLDLQLAECFYT